MTVTLIDLRVKYKCKCKLAGELLMERSGSVWSLLTVRITVVRFLSLLVPL